MNWFSNKLCNVLERLTAFGLLVIVVTVILQVILSGCFNTSITGANEVLTKLFVYLTSVGAAVAVGRREHIAISFAVDAAPARWQSVIGKVGILAVAILNGVVVVYSVHWIRTTGHYLMPTTQLPRIVAQLSVPIGAILAVLFCVLQLIAPGPPRRMENEST